MDIKGFKDRDGIVHEYDYHSLANIPENGTVFDEQIAAAVKKYLTENPVDGVTDQQIYDAVTEYLTKNPIEGVTDAEIAQAVADYMAKNPVQSGENGGYYTPAVTQPDSETVQFDFTASKEDMPAVKPVQVKLPIPDSTQNGNGLSTTAANLLITILRNGVYNTDQSDNIAALAEALAVTEEEEPDTPVEPDTPEATLTSISVVYDGGDVAVGTALAELTGIVVTVHYSDGTSETVTEYTLSGEIAEGSNTVTVSYQGKTATFTVNGITESTGENNGWIDGQAYELNKVDCLSLDTATGETVAASEGTMVTDFLPCLGVSAISWTGFDTASILNSVLYDEEKNFIKADGLLNATDPAQGATNVYATLKMYSIVPEGTAYLRLTQRSSIKYLTSVTPHKYPVLTETTECETGRWYESGAVLGYVNANDGTFTSSSSWYATGYCMVYGASKVHFSTCTRKTVVFYDGNKNYISGTTVNNTTAFEVPENAVYMAASSTDMNNLHIWLEA